MPSQPAHTRQGAEQRCKHGPKPREGDAAAEDEGVGVEPLARGRSGSGRSGSGRSGGRRASGSGPTGSGGIGARLGGGDGLRGAGLEGGVLRGGLRAHPLLDLVADKLRRAAEGRERGLLHGDRVLDNLDELGVPLLVVVVEEDAAFAHAQPALLAPRDGRHHLVRDGPALLGADLRVHEEAQALARHGLVRRAVGHLQAEVQPPPVDDEGAHLHQGGLVGLVDGREVDEVVAQLDQPAHAEHELLQVVHLVNLGLGGLVGGDVRRGLGRQRPVEVAPQLVLAELLEGLRRHGLLPGHVGVKHRLHLVPGRTVKLLDGLSEHTHEHLVAQGAEGVDEDDVDGAVEGEQPARVGGPRGARR
jgi:hypothetical protein